jgi:long-subunit fatty acid transport protein
MGDRPPIALLAMAAVCLLGLFPSPSAAQLVLGQYEEEAPVRSWNNFALATAAALGRGETGLTRALDASAAAANPALLAGLPRFTLAVNGYIQAADFRVYGPVNTGVILMSQNARLTTVGVDAAGISARIGGWTFALSVLAGETYGRPEVSVQGTSSSGVVYYAADFRQSGVLRTWQAAVARRLGRFSFGAAINVVRGSLEREFIETYNYPTPIVITDRKTQDIKGISFSGGLNVAVSEAVRAALVFRTPYRREVSSRSDLTYEVPAAGTEIGIPDEAADAFEIPAGLGIGLGWTVRPDLDLFAEAAASFWSRYKVSFFGDPQNRDFVDTIKAGLGIEYRIQARFFGEAAVVPLRAGAIYDPQPQRSPRSAYAGFTLGTGVQGKRIGFDLGGLIGRETGSGNGLAILKMALSLRFIL